MPRALLNGVLAAAVRTMLCPVLAAPTNQSISRGPVAEPVAVPAMTAFSIHWPSEMDVMENWNPPPETMLFMPQTESVPVCAAPP